MSPTGGYGSPTVTPTGGYGGYSSATTTGSKQNQSAIGRLIASLLGQLF
ncbi:MAG TPA: hypothetical protein VGJ28_01685 [Micromonosporaceae bacterium]|jgi:hypothetical protein